MASSSSAPPAYNPDGLRSALFMVTSKTLEASEQWGAVVWTSFIFCAWYTLSTLYYLDVSGERKMLAFVMLMLSCYSAVSISTNVRGRKEAELIEKYGPGTQLQAAGSLSSLRGTDSKYYLDWVMFLGAVCIMIYSWRNFEMADDRRSFLGMCGFAMLFCTFVLAKTIRDKADARKWLIAAGHRAD